MDRIYTQVYGVATALIERDGKILLVKESGKLSKNKWSEPGGGIDLGENPTETVKREVKEETGFGFTPTHVLGVYSSFRKDFKKKFNITPHSIKIVFLGKISKKQSGKIQDDILEARWFSLKEIQAMGKKELRNLNIKKIIQDYLSGKKYPLDLIYHSVSL